MQRELFVMGAAALLVACRPPSQSTLLSAHSPAAPDPKRPPAAESPKESAPVWPAPLAAIFAARGAPHAQPMALPPDASGRERWLAFVGPPDLALGAWRVARSADGAIDAEPVERWPTGAKVVGGVVHDGVAYVLLESLAALDQPAGMRAAWIDA